MYQSMMENKGISKILGMAVTVTVLLAMASCGVNTRVEVGGLCEKYKEIKVAELQAVDTLYSFTEDYPVRIGNVGDRLILLFAKQDTVIKILDKASRDIFSVAVTGNGPYDVLSPSLFQNNYIAEDGSIGLYDVGLNDLLFVNTDSFTVRKFQMPEVLVGKSSVNYFENEAVSYSIMKTENFFNISDLKVNQTKGVPYPFKLSETSCEKVKAFPTYLSPIIYANKNKNRILLAQYYFDMYSVYDMKGNFLKSVSLSNEDFDVDANIEKFFALDADGYVRYAPGGTTDQYVYLVRMKEVPDMETQTHKETDRCIVKLDWDGDPLEIIVTPEGFGGFCLEDDDSIIAIVNSTDEKGAENESFHIVRYISLSK